MNVRALLSFARVLHQPSICLPHYTVSTFDQLPTPLSKAFASINEKPADIRAIVLDKDNCFAAPHSNQVHPSNAERFQALIDTYSARNILIVSNSSGLASKDPDGTQAKLLEKSTGVTVLRHGSSKPACQSEILTYFKDAISSPDQIVVIGDRLLTDVIMANMMGARSIWIRRGVVPDRGLVTRFEYGLERFLAWRGYRAPDPS